LARLRKTWKRRSKKKNKKGREEILAGGVLGFPSKKNWPLNLDGGVLSHADKRSMRGEETRQDIVGQVVLEIRLSSVKVEWRETSRMKKMLYRRGRRQWKRGSRGLEVCRATLQGNSATYEEK